MGVLNNIAAESPALAILRAALNGPLARYSQSEANVPPEFAPFAPNGQASVFGVVVPAPEVTSPTWYAASFPSQGQATLYRTIHAGAVAWAQPLSRMEPSVAPLANALYGVPDLRVALPVDYLELQGADGLPVWVPRWSWRESDVGALVAPHDVPDRLADLVGAGRPGSALQLGRYMTHQLRKYPGQHTLSEAIWRELALVYRALNRTEYGAQAELLGGIEPGLSLHKAAPGEVPQTHLASVAARLNSDIRGFAGIIAGRVTIERAVRTRGTEEVVLHVTVSLDPTRRNDGADMAHVLLVQALASEVAYGPVVGEVARCCQRLPDGTPRPAESDAAGQQIFEQGYVILSGARSLDPKEGDLSAFVQFR